MDWKGLCPRCNCHGLSLGGSWSSLEAFCSRLHLLSMPGGGVKGGVRRGWGQPGRLRAGRYLSCVFIDKWRESLQLPSFLSLSCILHVWGCSSKSALSKDTANPNLRTWQRILVQFPTPSGLVLATVQLHYLLALPFTLASSSTHFSWCPSQISPQNYVPLQSLHNMKGLPSPQTWIPEKAHCLEKSTGRASFTCIAGCLSCRQWGIQTLELRSKDVKWMLENPASKHY